MFRHLVQRTPSRVIPKRTNLLNQKQFQTFEKKFDAKIQNVSNESIPSLPHSTPTQHSQQSSPLSLFNGYKPFTIYEGHASRMKNNFFNKMNKSSNFGQNITQNKTQKMNFFNNQFFSSSSSTNTSSLSKPFSLFDYYRKASSASKGTGGVLAAAFGFNFFNSKDENQQKIQNLDQDNYHHHNNPNNYTTTNKLPNFSPPSQYTDLTTTLNNFPTPTSSQSTPNKTPKATSLDSKSTPSTSTYPNNPTPLPGEPNFTLNDLNELFQTAKNMLEQLSPDQTELAKVRANETEDEKRKRLDPEGLAKTDAEWQVLKNLDEMPQMFQTNETNSPIGFNIPLAQHQFRLSQGQLPPQVHSALDKAIDFDWTKVDFSKFKRPFSEPVILGLDNALHEFTSWDRVKPNSPIYDYQIDLDTVHILPTKATLVGDKYLDIASTQEYCLRNVIISAKMYQNMRDYVRKYEITPRLEQSKPFIDRIVQLFPFFTDQNTPEIFRAKHHFEAPDQIFINSILEGWFQHNGQHLVALNQIHNKTNLAIELTDDDYYEHEQDVYYDQLLEHIAIVNTLRSEIEKMNGVFFNLHLVGNSFKSPKWASTFLNPTPYVNTIQEFINKHKDVSDVNKNSTVLQMACAKAQIFWPAPDFRPLFLFPEFKDQNTDQSYIPHFTLATNSRLGHYKTIYKEQLKQREIQYELLLQNEEKLLQLSSTTNEYSPKGKQTNLKGLEEKWVDVKDRIDENLAKVRSEIAQIKKSQNWPLLSIVTDEPKDDLMVPIDNVITNDMVFDLSVFESDIKSHLRSFIYSAQFPRYFMTEPLPYTPSKDIEHRPILTNTYDPRFNKFSKDMKLKKTTSKRTPLIETEDYLEFTSIAGVSQQYPRYAWGGKDGSAERQKAIELKRTADELKSARQRSIRLKEIQEEEMERYRRLNPRYKPGGKFNKDKFQQQGGNNWVDDKDMIKDELFRLKYATMHPEEPNLDPRRRFSGENTQSADDLRDEFYFGKDYSGLNDDDDDYNDDYDHNGYDDDGHDRNSQGDKNNKNGVRNSNGRNNYPQSDRNGRTPNNDSRRYDDYEDDYEDDYDEDFEGLEDFEDDYDNNDRNNRDSRRNYDYDERYDRSRHGVQNGSNNNHQNSKNDKNDKHDKNDKNESKIGPDGYPIDLPTNDRLWNIEMDRWEALTEKQRVEEGTEMMRHYQNEIQGYIKRRKKVLAEDPVEKFKSVLGTKKDKNNYNDDDELSSDDFYDYLKNNSDDESDWDLLPGKKIRLKSENKVLLKWYDEKYGTDFSRKKIPNSEQNNSTKKTAFSSQRNYRDDNNDNGYNGRNNRSDPNQDDDYDRGHDRKNPDRYKTKSGRTFSKNFTNRDYDRDYDRDNNPDYDRDYDRDNNRDRSRSESFRRNSRRDDDYDDRNDRYNDRYNNGDRYNNDRSHRDGYSSRPNDSYYDNHDDNDQYQNDRNFHQNEENNPKKKHPMNLPSLDDLVDRNDELLKLLGDGNLSDEEFGTQIDKVIGQLKQRGDIDPDLEFEEDDFSLKNIRKMTGFNGLGGV
jgi:hypothetical protein